ncbi:MAG: YitT family protein [Tuberibacillus sp.]
MNKGGFTIRYAGWVPDIKPINNTVKEISRAGILLSGAMMQGTAMALFLFPHHIPSGGGAGLALVFSHWFKMPLDLALWVINFSMLTLAFIIFGFYWTIRTMFSVTIMSGTVHILNAAAIFQHHSLFVDLLIGGLLFGLGETLLIRHGASSGGMLVPALMISSTQRMPPGRVLFWINFVIFLLTASTLEWNIIIYAVVCQWLQAKVIDLNNT